MGFSTAEWRDEAKHAWTQVDELRERIEELEKELNAAKWWADKRDICWDDLIGGEDD